MYKYIYIYMLGWLMIGIIIYNLDMMALLL